MKPLTFRTDSDAIRYLTNEQTGRSYAGKKRPFQTLRLFMADFRTDKSSYHSLAEKNLFKIFDFAHNYFSKAKIDYILSYLQ